MYISIHKQNLIGLKKRQKFEAHEEVVVEMLTKGLAFLAIIASFAVGKSFHFQVAGHLHEFFGQSLRQFWVNLGATLEVIFFNKCLDN